MIESKDVECKAMFLKAMAALQEQYVPGAYELVKTKHPILYNQIVALERSIDLEWNSQNPNMTLFRALLAKWYKLNLEVFKLGKKSNSTKSNYIWGYKESVKNPT